MSMAHHHHHLRCAPDTVVWGYLAPDAPAVLHIQDGDTVSIDTVNAVGMPAEGAEAFLQAQGLEPGPATHELRNIMQSLTKGEGPHVLTGPIHIKGAKAGDVVAVEILSVEPRAPYYGINLSRPGMGSLPQLLHEPWLHVMPFDMATRTAQFNAAISLPLQPFMGTMGLAPTERVSSIPPGRFGGNLDCKDMRAGSVLYLPVQVNGGLFFVGDGHALQGHGEVNLTALETAMQGTFRFTLHRQCPIGWPLLETTSDYIVMGLDTDLDQAAALAVEQAVRVLSHAGAMSPAEAYALCSMAVDFEVTQLVDGVKGIHGRIPKRLIAAPLRAARAEHLGPGYQGFWGPLD
jgi:acetamidase/formamidase